MAGEVGTVVLTAVANALAASDSSEKLASVEVLTRLAADKDAPLKNQMPVKASALATHTI